MAFIFGQIANVMCLSSAASSSKQTSVIAHKNNRALLLQFHSEYTSITDELESVCHMITSPTLSVSRNANENSRLMESQHLKECEEHDYKMLEKLMLNRDSVNESDDQVPDVSICDSSFEWII